MLTLILLTWKKWWAPASASKWRMGFNSAFNPYPANVDKMVGSCQCLANGGWDLIRRLTLNLLTTTKWMAPDSDAQMADGI
jgi:hypothetical protein